MASSAVHGCLARPWKEVDQSTLAGLARQLLAGIRPEVHGQRPASDLACVACVIFLKKSIAPAIGFDILLAPFHPERVADSITCGADN